MKKLVQLLVVNIALVFVATAGLDKGSPLLSYIAPGGAGQGEVIEVQFYGSNLHDPVDVLFYDPAIRLVEFIQPENDRAMYTRYDGRQARWQSDRVVIARIKVAENCRPGRHHLRLMTEGGLSVLRSFWVGTFPSIAEIEDAKQPNHEAEFAQVIPMNHTVNGVIHRFDTDTFKVNLKKGQRLSAEVEGFRLASHQAGETDLKLAIKKLDGTLLEEGRDSSLFLADPVLSLLAPEDGTYLVEVSNEIIERDGNPRMYRLHIGNFVRPTAMFPAGGKAGAQTVFNVKGDPAGEWSYKTKLEATDDGFTRVFASKDGVAHPVGHRVRVSAAENSFEQEPNEKEEQASEAVGGFPIALNGVIGNPGDVDFYRFTIPAGLKHQVKIRVFAQSIGSPLDARMRVYEVAKAGKKGQVKTTDDIQRNRLDYVWLRNHARELLDPIEMFNGHPSKERTLVLQVSDTHGRGGEAYIYRIEVGEVKPHVFAHMPTYENQEYYQSRNRIRIAQGNRYVTWMGAVPAYGFKLEDTVNFVARNLPRGITMQAPPLEEGADRVPVVFTASEDAKPGAYLFDVIARSENTAYTSSFQQPNSFSTRNGGNSQLHTFVDQLALCVTEPAPFKIEIEKPRSPLVPSGELEFKVRVERAEGYDQPIELRMDWVPREVNRAAGVVIKEGQSEGRYLLTAGSRVEPGEYQVALVAKNTGGNPRDGRDIIWTGSDFTTLTVAESMVKTRIARSSVERGKTSEIKVTAEFLRPFEGKAKVRLIRLPRGVEMIGEFIEITDKDTEFSIPIRATDAALFGMNRGVQCEFEFTQNGASFKEKSGYGYVRIDPERGKKVAKANP